MTRGDFSCVEPVHGIVVKGVQGNSRFLLLTMPGCVPVCVPLSMATCLVLLSAFRVTTVSNFCPNLKN